MSFFFEHPIFFLIKCAYNRGGGESCIQMALIRPFIFRLVLLLLFKCCYPNFECACSARQPDIIGSTLLICATYHANNLLNCARIASMRENPTRSK